MMNQTQAFDTIAKMRNTGVSYRDIAKHLEGSGYRSALTKKPIGEQAIRNIAGKLEGRVKAEKKEEAHEEKMYVVQAQSDTLECINEILELKKFSQEMKLQFIQTLIQKRA